MNIEELKNRIDCNDLAEKLGLTRPRAGGNFKSPHHKDKAPSLSVFQDGKRWKDHSTDTGGTCIDLVMYVEELEVGDAIVRLHELYGFTMDRPKNDAPPRARSRAEFIAEKCLAHPELAIPYLVEERKLSEATVKKAIKAGAIGFNTWNAGMMEPKDGRTPLAAGEAGYGGPAVTFIVRSMNPGHVLAVEMRYLDPLMNGGQKTSTQGEKTNAPFFMDLRRLQKAHTVVIVESPINALSVEDCGLKGYAAVATRGAATVDSMDWRFLMGKRVILAMDNDEPDERYQRRAGLEAAWKIHDQLLGLNIACHMVEQESWKERNWNDLNDILKDGGAAELTRVLKQLQPWIIQGQPGGDTKDPTGRSRIFLPPHDWSIYWRFRAKEDFVTYVKEYTNKSSDGEGDNQVQELVIKEFEDVCGFRIAGISRVTIASATSMMTGDVDQQPHTLFSVTVQTPRHANKLVRRVFEDEKLHNPDQWIKFGPIFSRQRFARMVNVLERGAHNGARNAINFVGLGWRDGKPIVNEGPDCYFQEPDKQCPYHNLVFASGSQEDARRVIGHYGKTFGQNAALIMLCWALGSHLKAFMGFWPHCILQARKGSGKSTLVKRLERTIGMTMFSGQSLQTEFRLLTSLSATSQPTGWEELSARRQEVIDKAVSLLQEAYNYGVTRRGSDMTEYVICAPVLLAGEDVPVRSLTGKVISVDLAEKGPLMPDDLPRFPMRQWLEYLASFDRERVRAQYKDAIHYCQENCRSTGTDEGAKRMVHNYAAVLTAWQMLADFADLDASQFDFRADLVRRMNGHIAETSEDREPWIWIVEKLCSEISARNFRYPYVFDEVEGKLALIVRTSHVMDHLQSEMRLREFWNGLTVKSDRVFKRQLREAQVIVTKDGSGEVADVEKTIGGHRIAHMTPLDVLELQAYGLSVPVEATPDPNEVLDRSAWFGRPGRAANGQ